MPPVQVHVYSSSSKINFTLTYLTKENCKVLIRKIIYAYSTCIPQVEFYVHEKNRKSYLIYIWDTYTIHIKIYITCNCTCMYSHMYIHGFSILTFLTDVVATSEIILHISLKCPYCGSPAPLYSTSYSWVSDKLEPRTMDESNWNHQSDYSIHFIQMQGVKITTYYLLLP